MADEAGPTEPSKESGDGARQSVSGAVDRLKADLQSLRADLESAARAVNQLGTTTAQEAMHQAQARAEALRTRLDSITGDVRQYSGQTATAMRRQMQEQPLLTLLIAAAAGFVLGQIISRR
jgi:ElaB/YqjD/DUF883 family membrane-anchored ribosome-binding protein